MTGDNRIRLDETPVDFDRTDDTGQNHDTYPASGELTRYDQMRSYLIGLLSNQSSEDEPLEKREGSLWFDKGDNELKIYNGSDWDNLSKYIKINESGDNYTIQNTIDSIMATLAYVGPRIVWSGFFSSDEINRIPIPEDYQGYAMIEGMQAFVYVDGLLLDPRKCIIRDDNPTYIDIVGGIDVKPQQTYTVKMEKVTDLRQNSVVAEG